MQPPRAAGARAVPRKCKPEPAPAGRARGGWTRALREADVERLWAELHRVVRYHPLVRACYSAGLMDEGAPHAHTDLTQELFTQLLAKQRFQHYLDAGRTDDEIEFEISQIELSNLLAQQLYKRHPESYRLARRVSKLVQSSPRFRCYADAALPQPRLVNRYYGLREWPADKPRRQLQEREHRVQEIPVCLRDTRVVGRTGDVQVIISNAELEGLIVRVLEVLDTPVDVRSLRRLVMSRLPVQDICLVPIECDEEPWRQHAPADGGDNPEQGLLRREAEGAAAARVEQFLQGLRRAARGKPRKYKMMLTVLWQCYLSPERQMTQLAAAARLGVSDTLISNYRQQIERQLRALAFSDLGAARQFEAALSERLRGLMRVGEAA